MLIVHASDTYQPGTYSATNTRDSIIPSPVVNLYRLPQNLATRSQLTPDSFQNIEAMESSTAISFINVVPELVLGNPLLAGLLIPMLSLTLPHRIL